GRIEAILDWAKARGLREGENPARWRGHLENLLPARRKVRRVEHLAAVPYDEGPGCMAPLRGEDTVMTRALEFVVLTAARSGELLGATWDEIDLAKRVWTVPGERMKGGRKHRVPLSNRAIELLKQLPRGAKFVFPGPYSGGMMPGHNLRRV